MAKVTVVIVFQQVSTCLACPVEYLHASLQTQRNTERILVRGCQISQADGVLRQGVDDDAFVVHRYFDQGCPVTFEYAGGPLIPWPFGYHFRLFTDEQSRAYIQGFLGSSDNEDLFWFCSNTP